MSPPTRDVPRSDSPSPDALLRRIHRGRRGHHKLYVGMAAGVGKTYRALTEIRELQEHGVDVLIGIVETHGREETAAALEGLPLFPRQTVDYKGVELTELDLDGLLERKPAVVLIDELAHTNVPGSKNTKRFEDVEALLDAGINVLSTMNVQHLESANDLVAQLTGVRVKERVPDRVLREADEVILVDVTPELLRERLQAGKIYAQDKIERSLNNFFTPENLGVLRELALRQVADAVEEVSRGGETSGVKERIAVAITPTPNATRLIRRGARLAQRLKGDLFVIYVKDRSLTREQERTLDTHRIITESLEGEFVRLEASDSAQALISFIEEHHITQVVMGASLHSRWQEFVKGSIINKVLRATSGVDVYVIGQSEA